LVLAPSCHFPKQRLSSKTTKVIELADKQREKVIVDPDEVCSLACQCLKPSKALCKVNEIAYIYQRIGFQCLLEARFEVLGFCFFQGELDPRILISYFPDLRGTLFDANPTFEVFSRIAERMPLYDSIDDISTFPPLSSFSSPLAASSQPQ
jgi:hypothetical protein